MNSITNIKTLDGIDAVVINGYLYNFAKVNVKQQSIRYRCRYKFEKCSASVTISDDISLKNRILRISESHSHDATHTQEQLLIQKIKATMKISAEVDDLPLQEIFDNGLLEFKRKVNDDEQKLLLFPEFENLKSTLYNHQKKKYPKLPQTLEEIKLDGEYSLTSDKQQFLIS
jgi:hypothetical protein